MRSYICWTSVVGPETCVSVSLSHVKTRNIIFSDDQWVMGPVLLKLVTFRVGQFLLCGTWRPCNWPANTVNYWKAGLMLQYLTQSWRSLCNHWPSRERRSANVTMVLESSCHGNEWRLACCHSVTGRAPWQFHSTAGFFHLYSGQIPVRRSTEPFLCTEG